MANEQEKPRVTRVSDDVSLVSRPIANADSASASASASASPDPNDEIPVPPAMSPAEIDERAQVVEALRGGAAPPPADA